MLFGIIDLCYKISDCSLQIKPLAVTPAATILNGFTITSKEAAEYVSSQKLNICQMIVFTLNRCRSSSNFVSFVDRKVD